ncbi:MAG: archease, partial [Candidatus Sericytochromatia bacterium]|nr:archease [Candidatus Sericytochromatia bacterium]
MSDLRHVTAGARRPARGHRVLPHPADVGLAFWAPTRAAAFEEAARGLLHLLGVRPEASGAPAPPQRWLVTGGDDVERLFKLLAQLIWAADAPAGAPGGVTVREANRGTLEVEARGA